ncbi:HPr kinase/phosphorylase [Clostridium acetobutylicum]|uniref:HPr kinase/phosphorylase n=1 Tax=Clostridium acetobutylicum (strain ATCC 824 / DSM 792 / JCM 1419 / IAM 19013 / LMG 5710 / NBRC 13948 / NRRL B-527 / VKM B-1787 / 2291 / W) TaxID=272562 RepID=HPRK_CLOAB|nr:MULTISPECIES: HPr(Ser) kinase/phosphatase [Clostridium]Q97K32.1 RecName: Full=HPr kinase/phosphorylase; Short=HPrK/P; AltName: Full=HPr(Ser) kinase/phosphorylase [Clostridium acetobutylicum ATCC 824]AAK79063.1 Serine kinase/phosphatase HPr [Clostridium acetobutylicum ATCC 824]ADZ20138.1 HPr kinase/phosphorylase [Clostridium acetobutylicum EA 2018]AEI33379.1 HPr kinase/phosphorylase [Clostridium acetobutylicum DSM 1731]AWV81682.1 HPr kinase/phosphorylase [Clostridium acetobutylicum]KHD34568
MQVSIEDIIENLDLEVLVKGKDGIKLGLSDINRPGLQFAGFYDYFGNERVQVIGKAEWSFLNAMPPEIREKRIRKYFQFETPCIVLARGLKPQKELLDCSKEYNRWLLRSKAQTTRFINKIMNYLDDKLAPETRIHGVLVDIYGLGILITGESGIGKSETALELIKRGHRLVADDAVDIKEIESVLVGKSPYITSGMLEVRGMGIIDVPALYGLSSVLSEKNINLVIYLEQWKEGRDYDRLGTDDEHIKILNIPVRKMTLPIRPGRNVAVIIEAAAANYRYNLSSKISPVDTINKRIEESTNYD